MNNQAKLQQELASIRSELEPIAFDLKAIAQSNHELDKVVQLLESANALINYSQQSLTASIFSNEQSKSSLTRQSHLPQQSYTYNTSHLNKAKSSPEQQIHLSSRTPPFPPAHSYPTTKCPHCELSVYKNLLNEHIRKMHPGCAPLELPPKPKKAIKKARKSRETNAGILVSQTKKRPSVPPAAASPEPQTPKQLNPCPVCSVPVRSDRLSKHIAKVHPSSKQPSAPLNGRSAPPAQNRGTKHNRARKGSSVSATSQAYLPATRYSEEASLEALDQSYRDRRDGGKELSQSRRDHGQFGSLPVYDDYSEDSYS